MNTNPQLTPDQRAALLETLHARFAAHPERHPSLTWAQVQARLEAHPERLWSLHEMERTGGEPDVVGVEAETRAVIFTDCAAESPVGRRNLCYDRQARQSRKKNAPATSALELAAAMGIEILTEDAYRALQQLGDFDTRTSSWLQTPPEIRALGGALFGDRRYNTVFIYHNGAESYYSVRGFRGTLRI
ncbi:MAG: DUF4256 domain-containing protein [Anaerolineae bacterium]|nr:DUF4256 domain-containing protein [Anaerolineae bacterium]